MDTTFTSLLVIAAISFICPLIARAVPGRKVSETVFLLLAGALLGPCMAGVIQLSEPITLLGELGLGFLFLLAGYEIDPANLTSGQGRRGLVTWVVTFVLAFVVVEFIPYLNQNLTERLAVSIALTTTALGTLMPILKERGLIGSPVGNATLAFGTWGELCPIIAIALLLSSRAKWQTFIILLAFGALCVVLAVIPSKAKKAGGRVFRFFDATHNTTAQSTVRATVLLLVALLTVSELFHLDIVLGAFAAGFILRYIIPEGNQDLEHKLEGIAYGFLIPLFFTVSGAKVDLAAVATRPVLFFVFILMLILVRAVPIYIALRTDKTTAGQLSRHHSITTAMYCATALPLIVAVTSIAVGVGAMSADIASVLVASGAVSVFLMPLVGTMFYTLDDAHVAIAFHEIHEHPDDLRHIVHDHVEHARMMRRQEFLEHIGLTEEELEAAMHGLTNEQRAEFRTAVHEAHERSRETAAYNREVLRKAAHDIVAHESSSNAHSS